MIRREIDMIPFRVIPPVQQRLALKSQKPRIDEFSDYSLNIIPLNRSQVTRTSSAAVQHQPSYIQIRLRSLA
jgi:hypothetical protein